MAQKIEVPVDAKIENIQRKLEALSHVVEKINRTKWTPVDVDAIQRDVKKVERMLGGVQRRADRSAAGGGPLPAGTAEADGGSVWRVRRRYAYSPELGEVPRGFTNGVGGGFGQIASYGGRGAAAGAAEGGGVLGGALGLLKGVGIGALVYGAYKAGQGISEGMSLGLERANTIDTLKRQMGDLGISFDHLKVAGNELSANLGLNVKEFADLQVEMNKASRGADKTPFELGESVRLAAGMARAYGVDPSSTVGFFGGMKNIDQRANNRELAAVLADTLTRSGMGGARMDEVMQALLSFAATTSSRSLSTPNTAAFADAYAGMAALKLPGLTPQVGAGILSQANAATMGMGAAGEPGQAFMFQALQRGGRGLNPYEALILAGNGLFGTRADAFGPNSAAGRALAAAGQGARAQRLAGGQGADTTTNLQLVLDFLKRYAGPDPFAQASSLQRLFGLQSPQQAMALTLMKGGNIGGLKKSVENAGLDINKINPQSFQVLSEIGNVDPKAPGSRAQLQKIMSSLIGRIGDGSLSQPEKEQLLSVNTKGTNQELQNALVKIAAGKNREDDVADAAQRGQKALENIEVSLGEKLLPSINIAREALIKLAGGRRSLEDYAIGDINARAEEAKREVHEETLAKITGLPRTGRYEIGPEGRQALQDERDKNAAIDASRDSQVATVKAELDIYVHQDGKPPTKIQQDVTLKKLPQAAGSK